MDRRLANDKNNKVYMHETESRSRFWTNKNRTEYDVRFWTLPKPQEYY